MIFTLTHRLARSQFPPQIIVLFLNSLRIELNALTQSRRRRVSGCRQSSVRRSLRPDGNLHGAAGRGKSQNIVHGLGDVIGLDHLATVELAVGWDQRRIDEAR